MSTAGAASGTPAPVALEGRHIGAVLLLALLWGFNWPAVRIALDEIAPWTLRTIGLSLGGAVLMGVARMRGLPLLVPARAVPVLVLTGLLSIAAFNILLAFAQLAAPTSRAAILTFTMPLWAALFARLLLGERLDGRKRAGLVLGVLGLAALGVPLVLAGAWSYGLLLALGAGMAWALGTVIGKRHAVPASALVIAGWQLLIGAAAAAAGMLAFEGLPAPVLPGPKVLAALAYHVLLAQALAYLVWFSALARVPAGTMSLGTLLVPVVGVLGSMLLIGERPAVTDWLGLALLVAAAAAVLPRPRLS